MFARFQSNELIVMATESVDKRIDITIGNKDIKDKDVAKAKGNKIDYSLIGENVETHISVKLNDWAISKLLMSKHCVLSTQANNWIQFKGEGFKFCLPNELCV